jgi:EAL domain-containing protein (putative c-di-GMP-specific phosphodiesterase class I)
MSHRILTLTNAIADAKILKDALGNAVIGNNLKLCVIAEGAENWRQVEFLRKRHCEVAQGYLFSRPVPADAFAELLAAGSSLMAA